MALRKLCAGLLAFTAGIGLAQPRPTPPAQRPGSKPGFTLSISANHSQKLTGPIQVTITGTNITKHKIYWLARFTTKTPYWDFRYDLERNGRDAETTVFNRVISNRMRPSDETGHAVEVHNILFHDLSGSAILLPHPPGRMFKMKINLKRLYHITQPGKYTFQVSRYDPATKRTVRSNILHLTIER